MATKHSLKISLILLGLELICVWADSNKYSKTNREIRDEYRPQFIMFTTDLPETHNTIQLSTRAPIIQKPVQLCEDPHKNIFLRFTNMGLNRIGDDFVNSSDVTNLDFEGNEIEEVTPLAFQKVPNLEVLNLANNKIPLTRLLSYSNCPNLVILNLDENEKNNQNNRIPDSWYESFQKLQKLYLRGNHIVQFDINLKALTQTLTHLYLSRNRINSTKFIDKLPSTLTHLYLDDNFITEFDTNAVPNIKELFIDRNNITQLCKQTCKASALNLKGVPNLKQLGVSRNKITDIEEGTFQATRFLTKLNLSFNKIKHLSNNTFNGLRLVELSLSRNRFSMIPYLGALGSLEKLDLSGNKILNVPGGTFSRMVYLRELLLNNNQIVSIDIAAFNYLNHLATLDLSNNHIVELPENWIIHSPSLQHLYLRNNTIKNFDKIYIQNVAKLKDLYLQDNPLFSIELQSICDIYQNARHLKIHFKDEIKKALVEEEQDYDLDDNDDENYDNYEEE